MKNFQGILYMNQNLQGDFQICISVPLMWSLSILFSYEDKDNGRFSNLH